MFGGKVCDQDNKLIKEFIIRLSGSINQMHQNFEESSYFMDDDIENDTFDYKEAEDLTFRYAFESDWSNSWNVD